MKDSSLKQKRIVKTSQKLSLGMGDLGYSLVANTYSSYILFFGNTVMGVSGTIMGLIIALGTVWDAVTDPIMGFMSDNTRSNTFGRRHLYALIGMIGMAIANVVLWAVPIDASLGVKIAWLTICIIALRTFTTLFQTPMAAFSLDVSPDYNERSSIQIYKSVFNILGLLLPTLLIGIFQKDFINADGVLTDGRFNPTAYLNFGTVTSASCILLGVIMFISTYSHVPRLREQAKNDYVVPAKGAVKKIFVNFFGALRDKNFRAITIGYMVSMVSASILIAVGFNVFTFTFKTTKLQMYTIMAGLFIMTIAGQPLWMWMSKKYDKKKALIIGQSISLVGCLMLFVMFLAKDFFIGMLHKNGLNVIFMMPPLMVAGLGTGVLYSLPIALIGDTVVIEKARTGEDKTATYSGFLTLGNKAGQAISSAVLGVALDLIGFEEGSSTQTPAVENGLGWLMCIGVTLAVGFGILIFSRCKMTREEVQEALEKVNQMSVTTEDSEASAIEITSEIAE